LSTLLRSILLKYFWKDLNILYTSDWLYLYAFKWKCFVFIT